ncbi:deoxynucleoside monophosphate kinase [Streptomyces phage Sebastisaurus]|uniref:Deoxynucleoside monophosphate kinase n=1 Tax=Streptomyces phage Sebastisaurus TaxID=2510572 RepID=A0A411B3S9_9CAUD|nr:deoxynucleoside monophosphate kinase [Streptomyces phage Sebastisaurus]
MRYKHVGLIGKARSGKDTVAQRLVRSRAYTRVAFADPLKAMAMQTNPFVPTSPGVVVRLAPLINDVGWEYAKERYPEVRRILQAVGQTVRLHDEDFWVRVALRKVDAADSWNMPVVITDVRYPNEAETLRKRGFALVRVTRPGASAGPNAEHESETALDEFHADLTIGNTGTLDDLNRIVDSLLLPRS